MFIVIDGIDGCGKSTQVKLLYDNLVKRGLPVTVSKWQDSSYIQKLYIGDLIKRIQEGSVRIPPESRTFLLGADISYRLENMIKPSLEQGHIVIGDRYVYKIIAQGIARGLDKKWLQELFSFAPAPELVIMLDVPPEVSLERITSSREISYYEAGLDVLNISDKSAAYLEFQHRVRAEMLKLMEAVNGKVIDGGQSVKKQSQLIQDQVLAQKNMLSV
ncbi:MAG: dTMP kinase [Candidatus Zixiibacteriota bacterium]